MDLKSRIDAVYGATNSRELAERYDCWASDYDHDLEALLGYVAPRRAAELLARHVGREARILDAGAGTGLVAKALRPLGYRNLVGIDCSRGMLARAEEKGVYDALYCADLEQPLAFPTASFGAVVSVGVFTYGHVQASCLDELIRVTAPGGFVIFSLRPDFYEQSDFSRALSALQARGRWELVEAGAAFPCYARDGLDATLRFWTYRVTSKAA
jgi:predicted TPR repeat methyltransferase